jgi:hypothetical protein
MDDLIEHLLDQITFSKSKGIFTSTSSKIKQRRAPAAKRIARLELLTVGPVAHAIL